MLSDSESVKHFFFFFPRYGAQSNVLLTSVASTLDEVRPLSSIARNINVFLYWALNLCKLFWPMSEACEIAQPVDLKLGKVSLFIKPICYHVIEQTRNTSSRPLCLLFFLI